MYQPYQSLLATCEGVRASVAMLTDQSAAQEAFQSFDTISSDITRYIGFMLFLQPACSYICTSKKLTKITLYFRKFDDSKAIKSIVRGSEIEIIMGTQVNKRNIDSFFGILKIIQSIFPPPPPPPPVKSWSWMRWWRRWENGGEIGRRRHSGWRGRSLRWPTFDPWPEV